MATATAARSTSPLPISTLGEGTRIRRS
jgi:hypothetical protein